MKPSTRLTMISIVLVFALIGSLIACSPSQPAKPTAQPTTATQRASPTTAPTITRTPTPAQQPTATPTEPTAKFEASVTVNEQPVKTGWLLRGNVFILDEPLIQKIKEGKYVRVTIKSLSRQQIQLKVTEGGEVIHVRFILDYHETFTITCRIYKGDKTGLTIYLVP